MLLVEEECYVSLIGIRIWNYDISLLASGTRLPWASDNKKLQGIFKLAVLLENRVSGGLPV